MAGLCEGGNEPPGSLKASAAVNASTMPVLFTRKEASVRSSSVMHKLSSVIVCFLESLVIKESSRWLLNERLPTSHDSETSVASYRCEIGHPFRNEKCLFQYPLSTVFFCNVFASPPRFRSHNDGADNGGGNSGKSSHNCGTHQMSAGQKCCCGLHCQTIVSRAVASWSKAPCLGLALRNARWFESSWWKKFSHEISTIVSRAVASWSKAPCPGLALRNARWFESSWWKKFSHEISVSVWDRCPPSTVMHVGSYDRSIVRHPPLIRYAKAPRSFTSVHIALVMSETILTIDTGRTFVITRDGCFVGKNYTSPIEIHSIGSEGKTVDSLCFPQYFHLRSPPAPNTAVPQPADHSL
ncbi:hypothetical protein ANN_00504 [Periplaneta americana]|uniref:Uncharacterized protein n=1 Tax=Periplaneta americana TaxID=6978 RepID=A0ABQ8TQZ4_PERAM|nr:hypothetical protein ANN_00504 [Periplaneta americana]